MRFAILDFETTGNQSDDELIQAGLVVMEDEQIVETFHSFIRPKREIPQFIRNLTGITEDMVADAPEVSSIAKILRDKISDDMIIVGHNVQFDFNYLQREFEANGLPLFRGRTLDTMDMLRILFPGLHSLSLSAVSAYFAIPHERPHQADSDAKATAHIWKLCMEKLQQLPLLTVQRLDHIFADLQEDISWFLKTVREQKELATSVDQNASLYYRQFVIQTGEWADEQPARDDGFYPLEDDFQTFSVQLKDKLRTDFPGFEQRESQSQMIQEVFTALDGEHHLIVEAGTGTGKSLGYLIPSLYYSLRNGEKMIVSTHTINLQEQLRNRDLPLLQKIFPAPFRASVLKGRNHYLCLRKFEQKINSNDYISPKEDRITAAQMIIWLGETVYGDDEELHLQGKSQDFWRTVESDTESCLNRACPWFKKCFYHRARHEASIADLVITNHSLLFTDVKAENRLLPAYGRIVIDEAHHFEETATKHLGIQVHYFSVLNALTALYKDARTGQLSLLRTRVFVDKGENSMDWLVRIDKLSERIIEIKEQWDQLCDILYQLSTENSTDQNTEAGQLVYRLKPDTLPQEWSQVRIQEDNVHVLITEFQRDAEQLLNELKDSRDDYDVQGLLTNISGYVKLLAGCRDDIRFIVNQSDSNYVFWLEANTTHRSKSMQLTAIPVDVSHMLREAFFDRKESVILTSATMSVNKSFHYTSEQLGLKPALDEGKLRTAILPSPFQYRKQALVIIPRDFPIIKGLAGETQFTEKLVDSLKEMAISTQGRMLVLFTSNRMLKQVYSALKEPLQSAGIQLLGQGVDSNNRSKLTRLFQEHPACVLLGTSSFWEGVDIPGEALSVLAIVRLPFQPPTHPYIEAKLELLKKENHNPFMKYSVPQAVIKFKQGFGRLVRTTKDRGIVIIYDTRVIDTFYGKHFLYSLPGPKIEHMHANHMPLRVRQWLTTGE